MKRVQRKPERADCTVCDQYTVFSELEAIIHIFDELDGAEGILVASKIADRVGITRSVIVNALRKFESAGVIESRSSGMKGTYIKVINDYVFTMNWTVLKQNVQNNKYKGYRATDTFYCMEKDAAVRYGRMYSKTQNGTRDSGRQFF